MQHPLEVRHAKNSARLLHLSLQRSTLLVGEVFDAPSPHQESAAAAATTYTVLLYPASDATAVGGASLPADTERLKDVHALRLVVLDATWRKSRKMLHANPWLQQLPRLSLNDVPPSQYRIRKAHKPDQLSTLEACCAALAQLEGDSCQCQPLLQAFQGFVTQQLSFRSGTPAD